MCEYCDNSLPTKSIISCAYDADYSDADYTGIFNSVYIEHGDLFSSIYASGDNVESSTKINFCPMCGRKLKDD